MIRVSMVMNRTSFAWLILAFAQAFLVSRSHAQARDQESTQKPIPIIAAGTIVGKEEAANWNRVVLLATPRIVSGDTTKLTESVRAAVSKLTLTILATVTHEVVSDGTEAYRLDEVGVAYSTSIKEKLTTISSDSAARLGARLDFFGRQMLSENEKQIANINTVVRTSTLLIFDTPTIMLRDGQHKDFVTRHLIWIDSRTGKLAMIIWLLSTDTNRQTAVAERTLRVIAPGTNEDRKIHVDGRSFFLGIPSARSFALEDLPPGSDFAWTEAAKQMAARNSYAVSELKEFVVAINQMLHGK